MQRTFYYRERTLDDFSGETTFNWHYDRQIFGASLKDTLLFEDKHELDQADYLSFMYNDTYSDKIVPWIDPGDLLIHGGMLLHIFTAGKLKAAAHSVLMPDYVGLSRVSQAFFFAPPHYLTIAPPNEEYEAPVVQKHDRELITDLGGFQHNIRSGMDYAQFNEQMKVVYEEIF